MKVITSPLERWKGTVTLADPLDMTQAMAIEDGLRLPEHPELTKLQEAYDDAVLDFGAESRQVMRAKKKLDSFRLPYTLWDSQRIPAIQACVVSWDLEGFTRDPFPFSPREDTHRLVDWIFAELTQIYVGEKTVPKE